MVACNNVALFVNRKTAVSVAVVSKAYVEAVVDYELLQVLNVSLAAVGVDVEAVGVVVDHICLCAESVKYALCYLPCCAV